MKHAPRSLFGHRILICEGATELGMMLGVRESYPLRHNGVPIEQRGAAIIDGGGAAAPPLACALASLGYPVAIFRDSDRRLDARWAAEIQRLNVCVIEYAQGLNTEQAIFQAAPDDRIDALLQALTEFISEHSLRDQFVRGLPGIDYRTPYSDWDLIGDQDIHHRQILSEMAVSQNWIKTEIRGRAVASIVNQIVDRVPGSALAQCLRGVEGWLYA